MKGYEESIVKLHSRKYLRLYYRNKMFHLPYQLPKEVKIGETNSYFDFKTRKLKAGFGDNYEEINKVIYDRKAIIDQLIRDAQSENIDPILHVNDYFNKKNDLLEEKHFTNNSIFAEMFETWSESKRQKKIIKTDKKNNKKDITYAITSNLKFYNEQTKKKWKVSQIDMLWFVNYCKWCVKDKEKTTQVKRGSDNKSYKTTRKLKMSNSTLKRHLIEYVAFLKDLNKKYDFINFPLDDLRELAYGLATTYEKKKMNEEWAYDYLSENEWNLVKNHQVPEERRKEWHQAFDLYLFCCYTGLRYTDMLKLKMINIQNNVIVLDAEKTATKVKRGTVTVPLNTKAKAIIEKYFPKNGDSNTPIFNEIAPTNQRANNTIRKVLSELPLLQEEKVVRQYYLKDYEETLIRKCDKISWHSSRRTFVNLLVQRGASPQELKSMTGWVDIKTLTNYMATMKKDSEKAISMINDF